MNVSFLPDLSILDAIDSVGAADELRNKGSKVIGHTAWSRLLEMDDSYRHATIRALGFTPPPPDVVGDKVSVMFLFNGNKIISKSLIFPYTKFMPNNLGCDIACTGYLAYFAIDESKLVNDFANSVEKFLRKAGHKGQFVIDAVIDKDQVYVSNISASPNVAYITAVFENSRVSKTDILLRIVNESSSYIPPREPWACGVLVSIAPYPYMVPDKTETVEGFNPLNMKHLWLIDAVKDGDTWLCGSNNGCLGYVTSRGVSIQEVPRRAYHTLKNIRVENIQYRSDIGRDVFDRFARLQAAKLV